MWNPNIKLTLGGSYKLKATGIVRRIDDLGRVVIPKEIRRTLHIREGDPLEIYTDTDGEVIFKKYSPVGELSPFASQYAEVLSRVTMLPTIICDRDHVVSVAGISKKEYLERRVTQALEDLMESRRSFSQLENQNETFVPIEGIDKKASVVFPIMASGDVTGAVVLLTGDTDKTSSETEVKLVQTAAAFLGKQMEE